MIVGEGNTGVFGYYDHAIGEDESLRSDIAYVNASLCSLGLFL